MISLLFLYYEVFRKLIVKKYIRHFQRLAQLVFDFIRKSPSKSKNILSKINVWSYKNLIKLIGPYREMFMTYQHISHYKIHILTTIQKIRFHYPSFLLCKIKVIITCASNALSRTWGSKRAGCPNLTNFTLMKKWHRKQATKLNHELMDICKLITYKKNSSLSTLD